MEQLNKLIADLQAHIDSSLKLRAAAMGTLTPDGRKNAALKLYIAGYISEQGLLDALTYEQPKKIWQHVTDCALNDNIVKNKEGIVLHVPVPFETK